MRTLEHFASWWSLLTVGISTRKSCTIKRCRPSSRSVRYGMSLSRWQEAWRHYMIATSSTEIWNRQMFSCRLMASLNLVTWMFQKLRKMMDSFSRKLAHPTMQVQRSGRISRTTTRVTSGRLDASYTKWLHLAHLFERKTWTNCSKLYCLAHIRKFQITFQRIWPKLLSFCYKWTQINDQAVTRSLHFL